MENNSRKSTKNCGAPVIVFNARSHALLRPRQSADPAGRDRVLPELPCRRHRVGRIKNPQNGTIALRKKTDEMEGALLSIPIREKPLTSILRRGIPIPSSALPDISRGLNGSADGLF